MTEATIESMQFRQAETSANRVRRRYAAERRFRFYGLLAISMAMLMLALLLFSIVSKGYGAFLQTELSLDISFDAAVIDPQGTRDPAALATADYAKLIKEALYAQFPEATSRGDKRALYRVGRILRVNDLGPLRRKQSIECTLVFRARLTVDANDEGLQAKRLDVLPEVTRDE